MTDHFLSLRALMSGCALTASCMSFFAESFVVPMALFNRLVLKLGLLLRQALASGLARLESLWQHNNIHATKNVSQDENI